MTSKVGATLLSLLWKRAPFDGGTEVELRQIFEAEDFGAELTPELKDREERMRERVAARASGQR